MKFFKFKVHRTDKKAYDVLTWTVETEIQRKAPELQMKQSLSQPKFESNLNWPVATKPLSICNASGENRSLNKSFFCNTLLRLNPSKPETTLRSSIGCCIIYVMRVARMIPISNPEKNTFLCWAKSCYLHKIFATRNYPCYI